MKIDIINFVSRTLQVLKIFLWKWDILANFLVLTSEKAMNIFVLDIVF